MDKPRARAAELNLKRLLPSAGIAAGLFVSDPVSSFGMASYHPNTKKEVSNYGLGAALGYDGSDVRRGDT